MALFEMVLFPKRGERNSPGDFWANIESQNEKAIIGEKLKRLCHTFPQHWGEVVEIKQIGSLYQVTASNYRIYLILDSEESLIVVLHICRKVGQKAKAQDLQRAELNLEQYRGSKG